MIVVQLIVGEQEAVDAKRTHEELANSRVSEDLVVDDMHRILNMTFCVNLGLCDVLILSGKNPQMVVSQLDLVDGLFGQLFLVTWSEPDPLEFEGVVKGHFIGLEAVDIGGLLLNGATLRFLDVETKRVALFETH